MRLFSPVHVYAGFGCAWREVYYELAGGRYGHSHAESYTAFAVDMGLMYKFRSFIVNAGLTIMPDYGCAGNFGVGYCF